MDTQTSCVGDSINDAIGSIIEVSEWVLLDHLWRSLLELQFAGGLGVWR